MSNAKKYTLTKKKSVTGGSGEEAYRHVKGDVINAEQYKALPKKHQGFFEEGIKKEQPKSKADTAQDQQIADLESQVSSLRQELDGVLERLSNLEGDAPDSKEEKK